MNRNDQIAESVKEYIAAQDYGVTVNAVRVRNRPQIDRSDLADNVFVAYVFPADRRKESISRGSRGRGGVAAEYDTRIFIATKLSAGIDAEDGRDLAELVSDSLDFQDMAGAGWQATNTLLLTSSEELEDGLFCHVIELTHLETVTRTTYSPPVGLAWEDGTGFLWS